MLRTINKTNMIYEKLLDFQKLGIALEKDGNNPHFKSKYTTLNEVLKKVKGPLNESGVIIIQSAGIMDGHLGLFTILRDTEDDTEVSTFMPYVDASTAQKLGSANTYLRRYSLITLLGLEDEDDDGNIASAPKPVRTTTPTGVQDAVGDPLADTNW